MTALNLQVGQGSDDCLRRLVTSDFGLSYSDHQAGDWNSSFYDYSGGTRFTSVTIPQGATIDAATMQFRARSLNGSIPTTYIEGEDADDAATFIDAADYDGRARTSAVSWTPGEWVAGTWYTTPELKTIIQAIIDRKSWSPGNALVTFWRDAPSWGGSQRCLTASAYEHNTTWAPKLDIDYTASEGDGTSRWFLRR